MEINATVQPVALGNQAARATELKLYTLENANGTRLQVSGLGAAVVSLQVKDRLGHLADVVLGYQDLQGYVDDPFYIGTVVGRYANRIAGEMVTIDDEQYKLSTRPGGYHQHGGFEGFNKKVFEAETFSVAGASGVIFHYTSPHLEEGFPGEFRLEVKYTLSEQDEWTVEYLGISNKTTIVNLTQHTYFNLTGDPSLTIDEHEFRFFSTRYLPVNAMQVPTGELAPVSGTPFDFTVARKLALGLLDFDQQLVLSNGYDHSFVLEDKSTAALKHAAKVCDPSTGRTMDVFTTEPAVHFYTGNFLDQVKGKDSKIYNKRAGFCLETQHFPDAPNHAHFPSTVLKAGEEYYSKTVFRFGVD